MNPEQTAKLYRVLLSDFAVVLNGQALPGSYEDRIHLTVQLVGREHLNSMMDNASQGATGRGLGAAVHDLNGKRGGNTAWTLEDCVYSRAHFDPSARNRIACRNQLGEPHSVGGLVMCS